MAGLSAGPDRSGLVLSRLARTLPTRGPPGVPVVTVDPRQVGKAIAEVIDNALHSTDPGKGHVAVHAYRLGRREG